jgi:isocitrate/isopropylmalate dehydrogenase
MAKHTITLIPGDGIGPEIIAATVRIIEASGVDVEWDTQIIGAQALEKFGTTLPDAATDSIVKNKVALKGPLTTPIGTGFTSVNVGLRKKLDLYSNVRPIRALPNIPCKYPNLNLVIVRENTEDYTPDSNTRSFPAWSKASKSLRKKLRPESRATPLNLPGAKDAKRSPPFIKRIL